MVNELAWGSGLAPSRYLGSLCPVTRRAVTVLALLFVGACSDPNKTAIREACINTVSPSGSSATTEQCECVASAAQKYLDKDDYALFARVSTIYVAKDDSETKAHEVINSLMDAGLTPARAGLTAMDFAFLAHKINRECGIN